MLFICMLALQLTGALLLLLNCSKGSKKAVIKNCFPGSNIAMRDESNNCTIDKSRLRESAHKIYLNIVAFADLVVGYTMAAFSPAVSCETRITVLGVSVFTLVLLPLEYYLSFGVAKLIYSQDIVVPFNELEQNGVDTTITNKELDEMFNDT